MGSEGVTGEETESEYDKEGIPTVPTEPNPFWKHNAEKLVGESISIVEDTAKQFVTVAGLLEGIYFHAIAFSDVRHVVEIHLDIHGSTSFMALKLDFRSDGTFQEKIRY
jgi:hypothetical protein